MLPGINKVKGIHPGVILKWELDKLNRKATDLAKSINEHKQTISAIINKRRDINPRLSIKLSKELHVSPDYFMILQASYDVKILTETKAENTPDLSKFRKALFWDTSIDKIDWNKNKKAIIKRVLERGNNSEIKELISFYGKEEIAKVVKSIGKSRFASFRENIEKYRLA